MMSSTCFAPKCSSSQRQLYIQVWYNLLTCSSRSTLQVHKLYHNCTYNHLPEDEPSGSEQVEDIIKITILF
jgi:hypothetical protein